MIFIVYTHANPYESNAKPINFIECCIEFEIPTQNKKTQIFQTLEK